MTRFTRLAIAVAAAAFSPMLFATSAGAAVDTCAPVVLDQTSKQVLGDTAEIESLARELEDLGAVVKVRALQSVPKRDLVQYMDSQIAQCGWHGSDGRISPELLIFAFSIRERETFIDSGRAFQDSLWLPGVADEIRTVHMDQHFLEGIESDRKAAFQRAFLASMDYTKLLIENPGEVPVTNEGGSQEPLGTTGPEDQFSLWPLLWVLGLVALVILVIGVVGSIGKRRLAKAESKQRAEEAYSRVGTEKDKLRSALDELDLSGPLAAGRMSQADKAVYDRLHSDASTRVKGAVDQADLIASDDATYNPEYPRSTDVYQSIENACLDAIGELIEARGLVAQLQAFCAEMDTAPQVAPEMIADQKGVISELERMKTALQAHGYAMPDVDLSFIEEKTRLANAEAAVEKRHFSEALDLLEENQLHLEELRESLKEWGGSQEEQPEQVQDEPAFEESFPRESTSTPPPLSYDHNQQTVPSGRSGFRWPRGRSGWDSDHRSTDVIIVNNDNDRSPNTPSPASSRAGSGRSSGRAVRQKVQAATGRSAGVARAAVSKAASGRSAGVARKVVSKAASTGRSAGSVVRRAASAPIRRASTPRPRASNSGRSRGFGGGRGRGR